MRRCAVISAAFFVAQAMVAFAQPQSPIPERRFVMASDTDFYGSDVQQLFDTGIDACVNACLASTACQAITYNGNAGACFLKSEVSEEQAFAGATSGRVVDTDPALIAAAETRAADLGFLTGDDLAAALDQAQGLALRHVNGAEGVEDLLAQARTASSFHDAIPYQGMAVNLTDAGADWAEYAHLLLLRSEQVTDDRWERARDAVSAATNAYLRSDDPALQASALYTMARALEAMERGRDMIPALRLAQALAPRDDAQALLDDALGKYGFRIAEHTVDADGTVARICASFSDALITADMDYAPFVALPEAGLAVESTDTQICVSGIEHGKRYALTFRQGLPAANGEVLARDVAIAAYVRDRAPAVSFPGRTYILPRAAETGIPVETVNAAKLDLRLSRISDRNLVAAFREDVVARPMDYWTADYFAYQYAETVWTGTAETALAEANRDVTTRLPLDGVLKDLGPGIYVLQASVANTDRDTVLGATQWFVISDIGFTTMQGTDGLHVFARSLADAGAKADVTVTLVSRANAVIATTRTDAQGYAHFAPGLVSGTGGAAPALVSLEKGDDFSFLSLNEPEFDLSDRGVAGRAAAPAIDVFLATDRGAYRAGETVHATILARDTRAAGLEGLPLTARLIRPDGVEYARSTAPDAGAGGRAIGFDLAASAPRGTWRIETFAEENGPVLASQAFLVEDFLPERIDFDLTLPETPQRQDEVAEIGIAARYLFGAPGADLPIEGDFRISATDAVPGYPGYSFGRYDEPFSTYYDYLGETGTTDAEGAATVFASLPDLGAAARRPLTVRYGIRLTEGSGRPVERSAERLLLPEGPVIGIKPAFADGVAPQGQKARFDLVAIGPDAAAVPMKLRWRLNRLNRQYQWYALYGDWNWDVTTTRSAVAEGVVEPGAEPAQIEAQLDWGEYELVVEGAEGGPATSASVSFYAGWYAPADATATPDTLDIALDKPGYRPGDTARLRIVPRAAGVALVTVISNRLIDMKAVPVSEGENTIDLPVTDDWGTGAYVTASVIRPLDDAAGRAPARALGLSYSPVDPGPKRLSTSIEVAAAADPRGALPVAVRVEGVSAGESAYVTLAAVDVGILNLTDYRDPDPEGHYFGQQRLGMAIRDIYGRLIEGHNGADGVVRSGGDGGGARLQAPPPTEELVAYFSGPLTVGSDGYARSEFTLPSFNGTVRLMAVAWSKSAIGQARAEVLVRDPVVVTASVPRFLAPGDSSTLRLEVVHASGPAGRMDLSVTAEGVALASAPQEVTLDRLGKASLTVPLTAPDSEGDATLRVVLTTPDGRELVKLLRLPVRANDPETIRQHQFTLAAGQSFTLDSNVFDGFVPGTGKATLALGPIARFNAPGLLATLDRYPYGCTEQITSRALPLLYFEDIATAMGSAGDTAGIRDRVQEAIGAVLLNQSAGGSFGLWYADGGDLWLDAFVTDFLSRARAQGYAVPDTAFRNALDNLRNQLNYAADFDADGGPYAYALMVLAREGAATMGDLRYYADVKADAFDTPIAAAQLGAALASYGDQTRADAMFARAADMVPPGFLDGTEGEAQLWRIDYGSNLRDATAVLALAGEAASTAVPADTLGRAVAARISGRTLSTQEATWALLATHAAIEGGSGAAFASNGAPITGPLVRVIEDALGPEGAEVITNTGSSEATLTLSTFGVPDAPVPASGTGYAISRSWYTLDGEPVDVASVAQGTRLVAVIEVVPFGGGAARLMVNDPLPAGFEIDNPSLVRSGDIAAFDWLATVEETRHVEFRQDRFLAALDWSSDAPFRLAYVVRAISPGSYHLPAATVEDMYRPDYRGRSDEGRVTVQE